MASKKIVKHNHLKKATRMIRPPFRAHSSLPRSRDMILEAKKCDDSPQTLSPSYRLAFDDPEFLLQDEQRAVRLLLEWQKPDQILNAHEIKATWPIFGSARIHDEEQSLQKIQQLERKQQQNPNNELLQQQLHAAIQLHQKSSYYQECVRLAQQLSDPDNTGIDATVVTGGGPGIMEAANKGASLAGKKSIGLNIVLPTEQEPNAYISPEYCFQFHYFAIRKMHFLARAKALFAFPGGFGTLDEVMETLTLIQTRRLNLMPIFLFGAEFWNKVINFDALVEEGVISARDKELFQFVETAEEAIAGVNAFYQKHPEQTE
ncbi:LOG family protein [Pleionea litopenaei]|uniref:AMP nucleosidase n=1 Tax=Pleionea litopenaei TaxID=3070815 RepID=A0AA51RTA4_9GAMM|nr:LOG family protein [Pleionea sp. HL-JVS1]WMS87089.1 LOG family protein [Pleionea sp. HL-JVS1]